MSRKTHTNPFLKANFAATHLFLTGGLIIPAFLFQNDLTVRVSQVLLFAALATFAGKRIKWNYFLVMVGSITAFNLLQPLGEVILRVGPLAITRGALNQGLEKGFTIVGLVFISLFSIRPDLRLPGRVGGLVARVFFYFERIIEGKKNIEARRLIESIDTILLSIYTPGQTQPASGEASFAEAGHTTWLGALCMFGLVFLNWSALFFVPLV
ncbi:MAG: hypothetical protein EA428_11020 [Spirochaetaceae bacterium]|nr:MAG: hypothetical protein EA428_11020 [Spirochaetaceae bacterium]